MDRSAVGVAPCGCTASGWRSDRGKGVAEMAKDVSSPGNSVTEVSVAAAVVTDGAYTLFVADFDDTETAWAAYQELQSLEDGATVAIDGVVVVSRVFGNCCRTNKGYCWTRRLNPHEISTRERASWLRLARTSGPGSTRATAGPKVLPNSGSNTYRSPTGQWEATS